jgi:hypothetical protein
MLAAEKVLSHREAGLDLNNLKEGQFTGRMGALIMVVEKTNKNPDRLFQMFMEEREIMLKKLRAAIGKTSLYRLFSFRIDQINAVIKTLYPSLFFVERKYMRKNSRIITTYCVHPDCAISESDSFFLLEFKAENETKENREFGHVERGREIGTGSI